MTKEYYQEHAEEIKQRARKWYYQNKDKNREYKNQWRKKNRERNNQIQRQYRKRSYQKHKDQIAAINKRCYQKKKQLKIAEKMIPFNELAERIEHVKYKDYEVFEDGSIWNWKKYIFMKQQLNKQGYYYVRLSGDHFSINRLIASTFDDRDQIMLKELHCHHCSLVREDNSISNLVFLPENLHLYMHKNFTKQQIISVGEQVKHLRGSDKTNQFVRILKKMIRQQIANL